MATQRQAIPKEDGDAVGVRVHEGAERVAHARAWRRLLRGGVKKGLTDQERLRMRQPRTNQKRPQVQRRRRGGQGQGRERTATTAGQALAQLRPAKRRREWTRINNTKNRPASREQDNQHTLTEAQPTGAKNAKRGCGGPGGWPRSGKLSGNRGKRMSRQAKRR